MKQNRSIWFFTFAALYVCGSGMVFAAVSLENAKEARAVLGLDKFPVTKKLTAMKIAIIDNGFSGMEEGKGYLPASAKVVNQYDPEFIKKYNLGDPAYNGLPLMTEHGRIMAQIIWGITGAHEEGPQFYLLNANGITNFRRAVRYAIEEKVDIILYSQNRECCGNFDGNGFLNSIVNQALSAGILWVNAAGNYGGNVFNSSIQRIERDQSVSFQAATDLHLKSHLDQNTAQLILTWNSSGPEEDTGTEKDLDLYLYDESGTEVAKSTLTQVLKKAELGNEETFLARERIKYTFAKNESGNYRVVVKAKGRNFNEKDKIRLVLIPEKAPSYDPQTKKMVGAVELLEATRGGEIMVPADNPGVITVGDMSAASSQGPTADGRVKPEIILENSSATFSNGDASSGSSNAAAYFAGILAVLKAYRPDLQRSDVITFPKRDVSLLSNLIQKVTLQEFAVMHAKILFLLEDLTAESPVMAGRYRQGGQYVLGIREEPKVALQPLCGNVDGDTVEFYLAFPNGEPECFTRRIGETRSRSDAYPWERGNRAPKDKGAYVEIRQAKRTSGVSLPNGGIWMTPTPEQLLMNSF